MPEAKTHGGARAGSGRHPLPLETKITKIMSIGLYIHQHDAIKSHGGAAWLRSLIDKAIADASQTQQEDSTATLASS